MNLIEKICALARHPFRRKMAVEVHLDKTINCTRYYICRVCGEVIREEKK